MVLTAIAVGLLTGWANAQPTTQETVSDTEWRRQTEARLQQLEQENRELRKQVGTVAETQQAVMKDAESRGFSNARRRPAAADDT
jgi:hypothetical protein